MAGGALINPTLEDYREAAAKLKNYADQSITLFDATVAILAARIGIEIWTYDHHFDVMGVLLSSANYSDSSGLARALALSFSRVAAARRIPVLPHVLQRIRDSSRAPDTRTGMTEKFDRADACVTILCRTQ
jgi:hypothetical protein